MVRLGTGSAKPETDLYVLSSSLNKSDSSVSRLNCGGESCYHGCVTRKGTRAGNDLPICLFAFEKRKGQIEAIERSGGTREDPWVSGICGWRQSLR